MARTAPITHDTSRPVSSGSGIGARLQRIAAIVRRIIGAPDYDSYLAHMRANYPQCTPLDPQAFATERLSAKYTRAGQRCC